MLGIGIWEMVLIAGIALVVIGPEKFPDFAKIALRTYRDLRGYMDEMKGDIAQELNPLKKELNPLKKEVNSLNKLTRYDSDTYLRSITDTNPKPKPQAVDPAAPPSATTEAGTPQAGDFGYDESRDSAVEEGPIDYQPERYRASVEEEEQPAAPAAEEAAPAEAPAAPTASEDDRREPVDDFDSVRQPEKLD